MTALDDLDRYGDPDREDEANALDPDLCDCDVLDYTHDVTPACY